MYRRLRYLLRHYFVPHESNNWRAKSLHPHFLVFYIALLLFVQVRFGYPGVSGSVLGYATSISAERLLELVNEQRTKSGVPALSLSSELNQAAIGKAGDMFAKNYWAHISPTGETPWTFITRAGYRYIYAGENLAKSFNTSEEVVAAWMNSPTHRANILKSEYSEIGFAVLNGRLRGEETTLVVQEFGARTSAAPIAKAAPTVVEPTAAPAEIALVEEVQPTIAQAEPTRREVPDGTSRSIMLSDVRSDVAEGGSPESSAAVIPPSLTRLRPRQTWFPFGTTKTLSLVIAETLLLLLCLDAVYIWRHRAVRTTGHTWSHIVFFLMLLGAMGAAGVGVIL